MAPGVCERGGLREDRSLHPALAEHVRDHVRRIDAIAPPRREALDQLAAWIAERRAASEPVRLLFICTHNSRRSHMGQLWAATAAAYFGVDDVTTFSGGTEATAFNPRAVASLRRAGFVIDTSDDGDNPRYEVSYSTSRPAMQAWSKVYDDAANPSDGFAAVMTCSAADEACPFVRGADVRIAIPYDDPKAADGTPAEAATYDARSAQIATEMLYVFSRVSS